MLKQFIYPLHAFWSLMLHESKWKLNTKWTAFSLGTCLGESHTREECSTSAGHVLQAIEKHLQSRKKDQLNNILQGSILIFVLSAWIVYLGCSSSKEYHVGKGSTLFSGNLFCASYKVADLVLFSYCSPFPIKGGSWYYWWEIFRLVLCNCSVLYLWMILVIEMSWGHIQSIFFGVREGFIIILAEGISCFFVEFEMIVPIVCSSFH